MLYSFLLPFTKNNLNCIYAANTLMQLIIIIYYIINISKKLLFNLLFIIYSFNLILATSRGVLPISC